MNHDVNEFISAINRLSPLSAATTKAIEERLQRYDFRRGKLLNRAEGLNNDLYFILKGVLRTFIGDGRNEVTTWIGCEKELIVCIGVPAYDVPEKLEALEDCSVIILRDADLKYLAVRHAEIGEIITMLLRQHCSDLKNRLLMLRPSKAEQKYNLFLHYHGHLANRVLLKYISSFLGITQETLSRVRAKMNGRTSL